MPFHRGINPEHYLASLAVELDSFVFSSFYQTAHTLSLYFTFNNFSALWAKDLSWDTHKVLITCLILEFVTVITYLASNGTVFLLTGNYETTID